MNKEELICLHNNLLIIMKEIDKICKANNIKYSMHSGTLLGAIRHHGFIPWDDDMDIAMMREDYDRFFKICETELDPRFGTLTMEKDPNYYYGIGKVFMNGTEVRQLNLRKKKGTDRLWVDIFPYDYIPTSKIKRKLQAIRAQLYIKMLEERIDGISEHASFLKKIYFFFLRIMNIFTNAEKLKTKLIRIMRKYDGCKENEICCICGFGYTKQILPNGFFNNIQDYPFETLKLKGFVCADRYLTQIFGDYMELPPEGKRETHNLEIIRLIS